MTTEESKITVEGQCRCGEVKLAVSAPPLVTSACHCTGCQRMAGSAFSLTASIPAEAFAIVTGEPIIGGLHGATQHFFCPHCLSWMFTRPEGLDFVVNVRSTMLDMPAWHAPFIEVCTAERLPWATTSAAHSYETVPSFEDYERLMGEYAASRA